MKKPTEIQIKALEYIKEHNISELLYVKKHADLFGIIIGEKDDYVSEGNFYQTYNWTHREAKIQKDGWKSPKFDWCIDGKTIKALLTREIIIPSAFAEGKYGKYPIAYSLNMEIFNQYFKQFCVR